MIRGGFWRRLSERLKKEVVFSGSEVSAACTCDLEAPNTAE